MRKKIMALLLAVTCMVSILHSDATTKAEVIHETTLEDYIMQEMSSANILGMGISIVSADKELYCAAYGAAGETEADYVLGSLSKSFTAAGIMRMAEDGDIALTDTVSDYLPKYKAAADITIQELLNHTSGITAEQRMSDLQVTGKRGEFQYANANYNLLGEMIEEVSGMNYEEYISDNILDPLDMTSTYSLRTGSDLSEELLTGYKSYFGFPFASRYKYDPKDDWLQVPSAYMISDIKDMGKYLQMYLKEGGDVLSKESIEAMLYGSIDTGSDSEVSEDLFGGSAKYGMGWMEKEVEGTTLLYHGGTVENFTTMMVLMPEKGLGITMMFNSMDYLVGQELVEALEEGIISIELDKEPAKADSKTYMVQHGLIDFAMLVAVLAAWMPIFLMGVWCRRRRNHLVSIPGIIIDVIIQVVLPTAVLLLVPTIVPTFMLKRFVPDLYYVIWTVILSLYLGGAIKVAAGIVLAILGPKEESEQENEEEVSSDEKVEAESVSDGKPDEKVKAESDSNGKPDEKAEAENVSDGKLDEKPEAESDSDGKPDEKPETKSDSDGKPDEKSEAADDEKSEEKAETESEEEIEKEAAATEESKS